ncbi:MAG: hemerythrin domain-containing protein [Calditrichia bacterium]
MKRHPALHGLSSEHHHGLVWARRLERTGEIQNPSGIQRLVQEFRDFWESDLKEHFRKEEDILFPLYYNCIGRITEAVMETVRQHVRIRSAVLNLAQQAENQTAILKEISVLLSEHIRFEERVLFEEIQIECPDHLLDQLLEFPELQK